MMKMKMILKFLNEHTQAETGSAIP